MSQQRGASLFPWFVVVGVLLAALSLRGPILAPSPVMPLISADYGLDNATAGFITSAPVLMFVLMAPFAALIIRRAGAEAAVMTTLLGVTVGSMLRMIDGFGWLIAGSLVIGASIMIGNIVIPVIIRRDVPREKVATVTAAYTAVMNFGSLITSLATAPIADLVGWPLAIGVWSILVVLAIVVWGVHMARVRGRAAAHAPVSEIETQTDAVAILTGPIPVASHRRGAIHAVLRPTPLLLMAAFALQCGMYYTVSTWLPTMTADTTGVDPALAGALASIFQGVGIAGAFLVPALNRMFSPTVAAVVIAACWVSMMAGLAFMPSLLVLWLILGGIAQAGGFVVIFATLVSIARTDSEAATMSAVVQGCAYIVAAVAAPVIGALHDATGGWQTPLIVMFVAACTYATLLVASTVSARR